MHSDFIFHQINCNIIILTSHPRTENKLAILETNVAKKEEIERLLKDKLHHCKFNAPGMVCVAREMKKYATILEEMEDGQDAEMEMYGHVSQ